MSDRQPQLVNSLSPAESGIDVFCDSNFNSRRSSAHRTGSSSHLGLSGSSNLAPSMAVAKSQPLFTSTMRSQSSPMISRIVDMRSISSESDTPPTLPLNPR